MSKWLVNATMQHAANTDSSSVWLSKRQLNWFARHPDACGCCMWLLQSMIHTHHCCRPWRISGSCSCGTSRPLASVTCTKLVISNVAFEHIWPLTHCRLLLLLEALQDVAWSTLHCDRGASRQMPALRADRWEFALHSMQRYLPACKHRLC